MDLNAGFYFVRGNERTRRLFQMMLDYILANPTVVTRLFQAPAAALLRRSPPPFSAAARVGVGLERPLEGLSPPTSDLSLSPPSHAPVPCPLAPPFCRVGRCGTRA